MARIDKIKTIGDRSWITIRDLGEYLVVQIDGRLEEANISGNNLNLKVA